MSDAIKPILSELEIQPFGRILQAATDSERRIVSAASTSLNRSQIDSRSQYSYEFPARTLWRAVAKHCRSNQTPDSCRLRVLAVAQLATELPDKLPHLRIPISVLKQYPRALRTIGAYISNNATSAYPTETDDAFLKDVRMLLGLSVPCGAQAVDLRSGLRFRLLVKHAATTGDFHPLKTLSKHSFGRIWHRLHTDSRDLIDFNAKGRIMCFERIADLLVSNPHVCGVLGTSWYYDPQLLTISPHLSYLQEMPLQNGAILIRNGPGKHHADRAISTSKTRRFLYENGTYNPVCYTIAWPRLPLLIWQKKHTS